MNFIVLYSPFDCLKSQMLECIVPDLQVSNMQNNNLFIVITVCQDTNLCHFLQKSARRVAAIDQMDWDDAKKGRAKKGLGVEYTSSDESEVSEDESDCDRKRFVTKRLSWEGPKLRELKDLLDLMYKSSLNTHVRNFQTERVVGDSLSLRGPPPNALKWTLVSTPIATSTPVRGTR